MMARTAPFLIFCVFLGLLIAACVWPFFVASGGIVSHWIGEGSILTNYNEPNQNIIQQFWFGYRKSILIAAALGALAAVDYLLLSQLKLTWIIAGLSLPIACVGLLFTFYKDPGPLLPTFIMTGIGLFIVYRLADLIKRLISR